MRYLFISVALALLTCCNGDSISHLSPEYLDSLNTWKAQRIKEVTEHWIPLVGLKWLEEGENTFGSDSSNEIIFPESAPVKIGRFLLSGDSVKITLEPGIYIELNDSLISTGEHYIDESKTFRLGQVEWTVIKRSKRHGVRIWDRSNSEYDTFKLDYYEPDQVWKLEGRFESYPEGKTYPIANVLGTQTETPIPGNLIFGVNKKKYSLDVMEGGQSAWFIIFADKTNGDKTYGAGRYMYVKKVEDGELTEIDFNRAYNPPCVFTEFATCPLPPPQNRLNLVIEAGEKYYSEY